MVSPFDKNPIDLPYHLLLYPLGHPYYSVLLLRYLNYSGRASNSVVFTWAQFKIYITYTDIHGVHHD